MFLRAEQSWVLMVANKKVEQTWVWHWPGDTPGVVVMAILSCPLHLHLHTILTWVSRVFSWHSETVSTHPGCWVLWSWQCLCSLLWEVLPAGEDLDQDCCTGRSDELSHSMIDSEECGDQVSGCCCWRREENCKKIIPTESRDELHETLTKMMTTRSTRNKVYSQVFK